MLENMKRLKFDKGIYKKEAILVSSKDFAHLGDFKLSEKKDHFELEVDWKKSLKNKNITGEFLNYIIYQTVKNENK